MTNDKFQMNFIMQIWSKILIKKFDLEERTARFGENVIDF